MMTRQDVTLGGGQMVQYIDLVTLKPTSETCTFMLTNITPINLIRINKVGIIIEPSERY